jgi:hypothetical protein
LLFTAYFSFSFLLFHNTLKLLRTNNSKNGTAKQWTSRRERAHRSHVLEHFRPDFGIKEAQGSIQQDLAQHARENPQMRGRRPAQGGLGISDMGDA